MLLHLFVLFQKLFASLIPLLTNQMKDQLEISQLKKQSSGIPYQMSLLAFLLQNKSYFTF